MKSEFLDRFRGEQVGWKGGRAVWMTLAPLRYRSERLGVEIVVPAEFITDLASVPRAPLAFWIAGGRGTRSAVIHDFPYQFGYWITADGDRRHVSRDDTDAVFLESLRADPISGAGSLVARIMYRGVRWGGRGHWGDEGRRAATLNPIWTALGGPEVPAL